MKFLERLRERARSAPRRLIFPEGEDPRIVEAAHILSREGLAFPTLLGSPERIRSLALQCGVSVDFEIVKPQESDFLEDLVDLYREKSEPQIPRQEARQQVLDPLHFGTLMVAAGRCHGCVAGATHTTGATIRAALRCIGLAPGFSIASSFFIMILDNARWGANGVLLFSDCAVVPDPIPSQLAEIAYCTAHNARLYLETEPRLAFLSFSTKGSASHPMVQKVTEAIEIFKTKNAQCLFDGELQGDAALVPDIALLKAPSSPLQGRANTLIFPSLDAANITYKLTERLAGARAVGPILQGFKLPINDLSRGCTTDDVINVAVITGLQAIALEESCAPS